MSHVIEMKGNVRDNYGSFGNNILIANNHKTEPRPKAPPTVVNGEDTAISSGNVLKHHVETLLGRLAE
ncbi:hypothetical protein J6590_083314 [Homalodisca vitripennis]|nr:hypothetical protein J6590_083314 [Homalodisca vitripennis]